MSPSPLALCTICGTAVIGSTCHAVCGGHLADSPREWPLWASHHLEKLLRRAHTVEQLRAKLRPEYQGEVFTAAMTLLDHADKLMPAGRGGRQLKLKPAQRSAPPVDNNCATSLFELGE
jgi:hypothetical protein